MSAANLLQIEGVSYQLQGRFILEQISLLLKAGERLGVIGPNGTGKTTLLKLAAGLIAPTKGQIWLDDHNLGQLERREIARLVGYVPQQSRLDFEFSVNEIVLTGRNPYQGRFQLESETDRQAARHALELTDLTALAERSVTTLSGGERQRVIIARGLAQQPRLLILDEPTTNLDLRHQHEIMQLLEKLAKEQNLAVLVSIHDLNLAARYCDRLAVLHCGQLVVDARPSEALSTRVLHNVFEVEAQLVSDPSLNGAVQVQVRGLSPRLT